MSKLAEETKRERALRLLTKARACLAQGEVAKAETLLGQAQRLGGSLDRDLQVERLNAAWQAGLRDLMRKVLVELPPLGLPAEEQALWQARLAVVEGAPLLALRELERARVLAPGLPMIERDYAAVLALTGEFKRAAEHRLALYRSPQGCPDDAVAAADACYQAGDASATEQFLKPLLAECPADWRLQRLLALTLCDQGRPAHAEAPVRQALLAAPSEVSLWWVLAEVLLRSNRPEEAREWYLRLLKRDPKDANALSNIASSYAEQQDIEGARAYLNKAHQVTQEPLFLLRSALLLPAIPKDAAEIARVRAEFLPGLAALQQSGLRLQHPVETVGVVPFYLAYHGELNRDLHTGLGEFYRAVAPGLRYAAAHTEAYRGPLARIRVGLVSTFFRNHSIGKTSQGFVERLDRQRFEVVVIFIGRLSDEDIAAAMYRHADEAVVLPARMSALREGLAALKLDVLFYQDIGMEPVTYFLAHARLAPVQCYSFGHPDTTGIPTMDWFISSALFEPADAASHYSERLWTIPNAGTLAWYHRPPQVDALDRASLGIADDAHFYLCAQTLFKFHPDFDDYLLGILEADPKAIIGLVKSTNPEWPQRLQARLHARAPALAGRIHWLTSVPSQLFHRLVATADVLLDTLHFNGMNTSLEAFAQGKAVVTQPGRFQRGRHTAGMYRAMGMADLIAHSREDYVHQAVSLAKASDARAALRERILSESTVLFENDAIIHGFETCFEQAVEAAIASGGAPA